MNTRLDKFFPLPDFLRMPAIGLDISDRALKYVELVNTNTGVGVKRFGKKNLAEGIIKRGIIQDAQKLGEACRALQQELGVRFARVAVPEELVYGFVITIPQVAPEEIRAAVEFQIEEHVPARKEDLIFDYEILKEDARSYTIKVNAILNKTFESYNNILANSGFTLVYFEPEPEAIVRSLILSEGENAIVVDIGAVRTSVSIIEDKKIVSATTVQFSGDLLTQTFATEGVSLEEAEKTKHSFTLGDDQKSILIKKNIDVLNKEIMRYFNYWQMHVQENVVSTMSDMEELEEQIPKNTEEKVAPDLGGDEQKKFQDIVNTKTPLEKKEIGIENKQEVSQFQKKIILCGGAAQLGGLQEYIAEQLHMPSSPAIVWNAPGVSHPEKHTIPEQELLTYVTALGLALVDFKYD